MFEEGNLQSGLWMIAAVTAASTIAVAAPANRSRGIEAARAPSGPAITNRTAIAAMPADQFWAIIARTIPYEADTDQQSRALGFELSKLSPNEIVSFETTFNEILRRSYSWDLWGAAYVVHGGASDDGFEYFRVWLVSKGRHVFETVSRDPDSLADMIAADSSGPLDFEEFAYVARTAWSAKTGKDAGKMPQAGNMSYPGAKPSGEEFKETADYLSARYPKLWKRFGNNPAG